MNKTTGRSRIAAVPTVPATALLHAISATLFAARRFAEVLAPSSVYDNNANVSSSISGRVGMITILARLVYIVPAAVVYLLVYIARRIERGYTAGRAKNWPTVDAAVSGSYELDENQGALSFNGWSPDEDDDEEYFPSWAIAIQYSYQADGELYAGSYFLPSTYSDGDLAREVKDSWV